MLPFLKARKQASITNVVTTKDGQSKHSEPTQHSPEIMSAVDSLMKGVHSKDSQEVADSLLKLHEHLNPKVGDTDEN